MLQQESQAPRLARQEGPQQATCAPLRFHKSGQERRLQRRKSRASPTLCQTSLFSHPLSSAGKRVAIAQSSKIHNFEVDYTRVSWAFHENSACKFNPSIARTSGKPLKLASASASFDTPWQSMYMCMQRSAVLVVQQHITV